MTDPRNTWNVHVGIVADPEIKGNGDTKLAVFRVAIDRAAKLSYDPKQTTAFINAVMYDNGTRDNDFVFRMIKEGKLKKGSQVVLLGSYQDNGYEDKEGNKRPGPQIVFDSLSYQTSAKRQDGESTEGDTAAPADAAAPADEGAGVPQIF